MKTIKINDGEFTYDEQTDYEKDGHVYCRTCNERVDGNPIPLLDKMMIFRTFCRCDREKEEKEKQRQRQLEQERLRRNCFISQNQINYTFENADELTDETVINKARNYVKHFDEMRKDNIGLILYGNVGSGKTYIACCIANSIITEYSYSVRMKNFSQILNDLQAGGFTLDRNEYIEQITNATLLILDDFGIERNTEYALEQIYNVINARYLKAKPTIITTNINFSDLEKEQSDIMLGRIYSRIMEMCLPLRIVGRDRRKLISKEKTNKAKLLLDNDIKI